MADHWFVFRLCMLAFPGIILTSTYKLAANNQHWFLRFLAACAVAGVIGYLTYGAYKVKTKDQQELATVKSKLKYGGFYMDYRFASRYFFLANNAQKFSFPCFWRITGIEWAQVGTLIAISVCFSVLGCLTRRSIYVQNEPGNKVFIPC
jgi:hypothetical protein